MKKVASFLVIILFFLTIFFMGMQNFLCLFTFGLLIFLFWSGKLDTYTPNNLQTESYSVGRFQQKISKLRKKLVNYFGQYVGLSMCIWYIFYLLGKYEILSAKYLLTIVLPLHLLSFFLFIIIEELIIITVQKKYKDRYNTTILAECTKIEKSIYPNDNIKSNNYKVTYKFNYKNKEHIVSNLEPQPYLQLPVCGQKYVISINNEDPNDFDDENINVEINFIFIIIFSLILIIFLSILIYVWTL